MDKIRVRGGKTLNGTIEISGAKNAALPLMTAALLTEETLTLTNVPHLADITAMANLLAQHGTDVALDGGAADGGSAGRVLRLTTPTISSTTAPYDLVRKMRASALVLGPLVARCGEARVSLPGGCGIGARPVDLHIKAMEAMGATVDLDGGYMIATAKGGLKGGRVVFPKVSVGATESALMAATLAKGETEIVNAAREPEVIDLGHCLLAMGAQIEGLGTDRILVQGKTSLHGANHRIVADRIEAGTYAIAAAITGGNILLKGCSLDLLPAFIDKLREAGVSVEQEGDGIRVIRKGALVGVDVMTEPYPGFPTDLQAQTMALMTVAEGASMVTETIFENRFMHVPELARMGANINIHGSSAMVRGVKKLRGAPVMATDLRASVSLVLAGLVAEGETLVQRVYHLDRGYERLEAKLAACGADIERVREAD